MTVDARSGLETIDRATCLRLLASEEVGRLAVVQGTSPIILPVNYLLDGTDIVFRTAHGTKLDDGPRARACFEIDCIDRATRSGWSVVALGRLEEVTPYDSKRWQRLAATELDPWAAGTRTHWMRLATTVVTGRRVGTRP